jgi:hypothetical protein
MMGLQQTVIASNFQYLCNVIISYSRVVRHAVMTVRYLSLGMFQTFWIMKAPGRRRNIHDRTTFDVRKALGPG